MPRFSEIAKQRKTRAKKSDGDDKKRKNPPTEDDVVVPEPAAPKASKQNSLVIKEPTPQALAPLPQVEGKGKQKVLESALPPKKPKHNNDPPPSVPPMLAPRVDQEKILKTQLFATLNPAAGDTGLTMATDYAKWLGQCMTSVAPEVWNHVLVDQPNSLLSFGLMSSFIVSIP